MPRIGVKDDLFIIVTVIMIIINDHYAHSESVRGLLSNVFGAHNAEIWKRDD